ncbi:MAG: glycoside hydrolase family 3 N-terminal domain-containing protein [Phycisphaerales bacterium]
MNTNELIGGCIMTGIRGATLDDPVCRSDVELLKSLNIRGVILFDVHLPSADGSSADGPSSMRNIVNEQQVRQLTDDLRHELGDDLLIGIDQEGGEVNRLSLFQDPAVSSMLSAKMQGVMSEAQLEATISIVASSLSDSGINLVFGPCVDLAVNPENPIISGRDRSFGRDPLKVASSAIAAIRAYHSAGVCSCIKHFPGHGSSTTDTHLGIADITESWHHDEQLVYEKIIRSIKDDQCAPAAVMTGHLVHQGVDPEFPASLSDKHTTAVLRDQLGFDGIVITDSIDMGAIRNQYTPGEAAIKSLIAGADIVLDGFNAPDSKQSNKELPDAHHHPASEIHASIVRAVEIGSVGVDQLIKSNTRRAQLLDGLTR